MENIEKNINNLDLSKSEISEIKNILNRTPNELELEIFNRLWSEHSTYKNSKSLLNTLPKEGENVIIKAGEESAGAIDIGNGYACIFKLESHNHPCSIQPWLGALTGLRVVNRDILSMGAKPIAFLNSLRFGDSEIETSRWLFSEVLNGIKDFGKNIKVPVVGGEVMFDKGFNSTPIVNNLAVGIIKKEEIISGIAKKQGDAIIIIGSLTEKHGVDNDVFAYDFLTNDNSGFSFDKMKDSTIELSLLKAINKLRDNKLIEGIQNIGSTGIIGAIAEMSGRGNLGVDLNINDIPSEEDMTAREIVLSETWGRVLLCVDSKNIEKVNKILQPLPIAFAQIGEVIEEKLILCNYNNKCIAKIPIANVGFKGNVPKYDRELKEPNNNKSKAIEIQDITEPDDYKIVINTMLKSINIVSKSYLKEKFNGRKEKKSINSQYPSDAAYVETSVANTNLTMTVDCNSYYVEADPYIGSQIAVAEAARNTICAGGTPLAVTDCLNFGSPYDPEVFWQFSRSVEGIAHACKKFNIPVISGNVSFYNQLASENKLIPIPPTPVVGIVGKVNDINNHTVLHFKHKGDMIFLIGKSRNDINASEYLNYYHKIKSNRAPYFDINEELAIQKVVSEIISEKLVRSVHDVSSGGLFFNLLESAIPMKYGFDITSDAEVRKDAFLFGESQSRIVVTVAPEKQDDFVDFMLNKKVNFSALGHVTKGEIRVDDYSFGYIDDYYEQFQMYLKKWLS